MIPLSTVREIFTQLSAYLSITVIRGQQRGAVPEYPVLSYISPIINTESPHQNSVIIEENIDDSTSADVIEYEKTDEVFSLTFLDKDRLDRIHTAANQAFQWFKSIAGREYGKARGVVFQMVSQSVENRSAFFEAYWENRLGFDIRFIYQGGYTQTIEAIENIVISPTRDGESRTDITIP